MNVFTNNTAKSCQRLLLRNELLSYHIINKQTYFSYANPSFFMCGSAPTSHSQPHSHSQSHICQKWPTGTASFTYVQKRFYMRKKTMKILPTKPLNFDYGGDIVKELSPLDMTKPKLQFDGADELKDADELMKKLLSVEFGDGQEKLDRRIHDLLSKVKEHPLDVRSLEVQIAFLTVAVRNQMRHCLRFRKDKAAKSRLVHRIQARGKQLRRLRAVDYDKFMWLCQELQLKIVPIPEYNRKPSKRALLKQIAKAKYFAVIRQKTELFKQKLEEEKKQFLEQKELELKQIEQELSELNIEESSYLGKYFAAVKSGNFKSLDEKSSPPKGRRLLILEKKFELAEAIKNEREDTV